MSGKENDKWFSEAEDYTLEPLYTKIKWKIKKTLYRGKSSYQKIDFYLSYDHGIMLCLDDVVMFTEKDEFIYHEMLSHVPLFSHPSPKKLLVIGGGDLGILREVLKHDYIEEAHLCEIDKMVVDKCLEFLPHAKDTINNPRVQCFFEDGFEFLKTKHNYYDIIIIDSTDPIGEAEKLFGTSFLKLVSNALRSDGIMTMQSGSPFYNTDFIASFNRKLSSLFPITSLYTASCHSYPGGYWGFFFASKKHCQKHKGFQKQRYDKLDCSYYNEEIHKAAFCLPQYVKDALG